MTQYLNTSLKKNVIKYQSVMGQRQKQSQNQIEYILKSACICDEFRRVYCEIHQMVSFQNFILCGALLINYLAAMIFFSLSITNHKKIPTVLFPSFSQQCSKTSRKLFENKVININSLKIDHQINSVATQCNCLANGLTIHSIPPR